MSLEIFPQAVELLPNNHAIFGARTTDLRALWTRLSNGYVRPDGSVAQSIPSGGAFQSVAANDSAQQLVGGGGSFEFAITPNSRPSPLGATGDFSFSAFFGGPSGPAHWVYGVVINPEDIAISDESLATIATLPHIVAVGDRFRVELANGFRLFVNDILRHERVTGFVGGIRYPAFFGGVVLSQPSGSGALIIPAPLLSGDWQLRERDQLGNPVVAFATPSHGSITQSGLSAEYFNGTIPGTYRLKAKIDPGFEIWAEDGRPTGSTESSGGGAWSWSNANPPGVVSGNASLQSPVAVGESFYLATGATRTLQINTGDVIAFWAWVDPVNPTQSIVFQLGATDATGFEHRAYWGANLYPFGIDGTASRRFIGALPPPGVWTRLQFPASALDLEGRTLNGLAVSVFNGRGAFDQFSKIPNLQSAEALITIPPLRIIGPSPRVMQPSQVSVLQTNYDVGPGVTWSVVSGGGSFSSGVFTAPSTPGTTVVRATFGNQIADLTINIPAVITPGFTFAGPSEEINWDTNIPSPTWTASAGSINSSTGEWIAPNNLGLTVRIQASDGIFTAVRDVLIIEKFPLSNPTAPITVDLNKTVLISESEDRSSFITRVKDKDGLSYQSREVQFLNCELSELEAAIAFWERHFPGGRFILEDNARPAKPRIICRFDSALRWQEESSCAFNISFRIREVL
jgi:hypothetical protein